MSNVSKEKIDQLILNYFIQEGFQEAALNFAKEIDVKLSNSVSHLQETQNNTFLTRLHNINSINDDEFSNIVEDYFNYEDSNEDYTTITNSKMVAGYSTMDKRREIKLLILKGEITSAIKKIGEYFPTVLDSNNLLHFKLLRLNLIEMIKNHRLNTIDDDDNEAERIFLDQVLTFVRDNLINKVTTSFRLLKELETTMSLLCFNFDPNMKSIEDQKDFPEEVKSLFDLSLRNQCYRLVNKAILNLDSNEQNESLSDSEEYTFKGPMIVDFDLNTLINSSSSEKINQSLRFKEEDENSVDYNFSLNYNQNVHQLPSNKSSESLNEEENEKELTSKSQGLTLESKLEKIIKLWAITEQRLLDLNIIKEKRYNLDNEFL